MATVEITDDNFDATINGETPVVVDFWAEWCGPCKQMAPSLEAAADELSGEVRFAKINIDDNPMKASMYGVRGIPTLMLFKDGKLASTHQGALSKQGIADWIKESA